MSDVQLSASERETRQANLPSATPVLDETLWLAWKEKNRAKDQIWSAHRRRLLMVLFSLAVVGLIAASSRGRARLRTSLPERMRRGACLQLRKCGSRP